jgi:hypothetical protein
MLAGVVVQGLLVTGCLHNAPFELAAADALLASANELDRSLHEYQADLQQSDAVREEAVIGAFVQRLRNDSQDEAAVSVHVAAFKEALARIQQDRRVADERFDTAAEHIDALREVAAGMETLAVQQLSLQDDMRRYLRSWIDARRTAERKQQAFGDGAESRVGQN